MKTKLLSFIFSFIFAFFIFSAVVVGVFAVGFRGENTAVEHHISEQVNQKTVCVLFFLSFGDGYCAAAEFDFNTKSFFVEAVTVESENFQEIKQKYCSVYEKDNLKFVEYDEENFAKITDKMGGIVYNNYDYGLSVRYTGAQMLEIMSDQAFVLFVRKSINEFLSSSKHEHLYFDFVNDVKTDISYKNFYDSRKFYNYMTENFERKHTYEKDSSSIFD